MAEVPSNVLPQPLVHSGNLILFVDKISPLLTLSSLVTFSSLLPFTNKLPEGLPASLNSQMVHKPL